MYKLQFNRYLFEDVCESVSTVLVLKSAVRQDIVHQSNASSDF